LSIKWFIVRIFVERWEDEKLIFWYLYGVADIMGKSQNIILEEQYILLVPTQP
jgi:hypothetical protein